MSSDLDKYPELAQVLLRNRGILTHAAAEKFLNPNFERDIYDPFLMLNMKRAVDRILRAIDNNEKIIIFGDYDCDGIPGSVVMHDFFKKIGYTNFQNYIPHRNNEGYGLNIKAVEKFAEDGATLMITVDCGITDVAEVSCGNKLGIDTIITDHHLPQDVLPQAYTILNSKQASDTYPDNMLCGAGVAWKLVSALLALRGETWGVPVGWEKWLLDMAGLSTIADMVPLQNENRVLAYYGLLVLKKTRRLGLKKLFAKMDMNQANIVEDDVGFMIGPRINAASRMGVPMDAFRLLASTDEKETDELADHLTHLNDTRKGLVASMVKEAKKHIDIRIASDGLRDLIVIGNPLWKPGLAGLVASNIVESYSRTTFVWGRTDDGLIKGSCRSDGTCNVVDLMTSTKTGVFVDVGGHAQSGGFSVEFDSVHTLEDELVSVYQKIKSEKKKIEQAIDATLALSEANWTTWRIVERFAPFGQGNPKPVFLFENVRVSQVRKFGKEKTHLELSFDGSSIKAIAFFAEEEINKGLVEGNMINLVATMELNMFRGKKELRLRVVSMLK